MTLQFLPATSTSGRRTDDHGHGTRFWPGFSVGVCAATVTGALIATGSLVADRVASVPLFEIGGTVTLVDGSTHSNTPGFECEGDRGYDDIAPATAVRVTAETGKLLAEGSLTRSVREGDFCTFFFTVPDVPRGATFYDVEISYRGSISFDENEARSGVHLTLGR
ncbi:hypothetical protein [Rhodococcus sp. (in: high G+C Gram-positive bacteria)]|uniref:hypothetical protein n=1 Tax=Rhodococcus sp. TaxID=1831 RepID=UPI0019E6B92B|nr:hypothetical protein [Rhodococcus sp. (in: high G+C Gram-positive bacteria)]MBF0660766.1 hypothetical protein [Rhodococcus sp. (in: high G+C Gram-positive bacteria)]